MENKAEIQYELDLNDVKSYLDYSWNKTGYRRALKILRILGIIFGLIMVVIAIIFLISGQVDTSTSIVVGIVGIFVSLFNFFGIEFWRRIIYQPIIRGYSRKPNTIIGKHHLSITSDGISDVNEIGQTSTPWKGIHRYANNDQYLFLYGYFKTFFIVPRRAFPNEASFNQFVEVVKSYYEKNSKIL